MNLFVVGVTDVDEGLLDLQVLRRVIVDVRRDGDPFPSHVLADVNALLDGKDVSLHHGHQPIARHLPKLFAPTTNTFHGLDDPLAVDDPRVVHIELGDHIEVVAVLFDEVGVLVGVFVKLFATGASLVLLESERT